MKKKDKLLKSALASIDRIQNSRRTKNNHKRIEKLFNGLKPYTEDEMNR